jgi:hypothetical protein
LRGGSLIERAAHQKTGRDLGNERLCKALNHNCLFWLTPRPRPPLCRHRARRSPPLFRPPKKHRRRHLRWSTSSRGASSSAPRP